MPPIPPQRLENLQREFADLRFGMFIHFGILTYTGQWAEAKLDISRFHPDELDPGQWADAARSAGMRFGVFTTRHHDGFCLWQTKTGSFGVGQIPWRNGQGDVVREYADAFRSRGLLPGLYYSVWDTTRGVGEGPVTEEHILYVKDQLRELLTQYGPIPLLVLDGWAWKMGHRSLPYDDLRSFIRALQPDCLVADHTHLQCLWNNDLVMFEEPKGVFAPEGNTLPAAQGNKIINGNDWFWGEKTEKDEPLSVEEIVQKHLIPLEERYTVFILNCPPNRQGLLDEKIVRRLAETGRDWKPDAGRPALPETPLQNKHPVTPRSATATSGDGAKAVEGINDAHYYAVWESDKKLPQSVTLDLGAVQKGIGRLYYVPKYVVTAKPTDDGAITSYAIHISEDGTRFVQVAEGVWPADSRMKTAVFPPSTARYVRLEAREAKNGFAAATEITVGRTA